MLEHLGNSPAASAHSSPAARSRGHKGPRSWFGAALVVLCLACPVGAQAQEISRIQFTTERGEAVAALYAAPSGNERRPAVIYNHGTVVRLSGYEGAKAQGMDVADFVRAIAAEGYVAIAPFRDFLAGSAMMQRGRPAGDPKAWDEVVERGVRTVNGAAGYLAGLPNVDPKRIGVIGFSEGGNVTLWTAMDNPRFGAIVLLAPAALTGMKYSLKDASELERLQTIGAPVLLAVGAQDAEPIRQPLTKMFVPNMEKLGKVPFRYRTDYPGGHEWFYRVREPYWNEVRDFLRQSLAPPAQSR